VIAAVNGIACGGAFYMLGEVEFIIATEDATFFDPHVTYGMTASFEPMHMLQKMPFHEIMRLSLLGNYERLSAKRAYEIGLVSEVVPREKLREAAAWAAGVIAAQPPLAIRERCARIWAARDSAALAGARHGLRVSSASAQRGVDPPGQEAFASKQRPKWKLR